MGDFVDMDSVVAALAGTASNGCRAFYRKQSITTVTGNYYSSWTLPGLPVPPTSFPTTQAVCTKDTLPGAITQLGGIINAPSGGTSRLLNWFHLATTTSNDAIYDRLAHMGGLSGTVTTPQTVNLDLATVSAAGRCAADGSDVEWFLESFQAAGGTSPGTITITYTNQSDVGSRTTTIAGAATMFPVSRLIPITTLQAGDTSIKSIQSVDLTSSTGTAGNIGVVAMKRISPYVFSQNLNAVLDFTETGLPKVPDDACLQIVSFAGTTTAGIKEGQIIVGSRP